MQNEFIVVLMNLPRRLFIRTTNDFFHLKNIIRGDIKTRARARPPYKNFPNIPNTDSNQIIQTYSNYRKFSEI